MGGGALSVCAALSLAACGERVGVVPPQRAVGNAVEPSSDPAEACVATARTRGELPAYVHPTGGVDFRTELAVRTDDLACCARAAAILDDVALRVELVAGPRGGGRLLAPAAVADAGGCVEAVVRTWRLPALPGAPVIVPVTLHAPPR